MVNKMSKVIKIKIDEELDKKRIEAVLKSHMGFSSSLITSLKNTTGGVMLCGKNAKMIDRVTQGDLLEIMIDGKNSENIIPVKMPIDIIYEDEDILAVNKSGNMPVHPSKNHKNDTLANGLMYYLKESGCSLHIITRLDRETSGVVLVAKNVLSAQRLTQDVKNRKFDKEYVAVVNSDADGKSGVICKSIKKKEKNGILRCVADDGKESITHYCAEKTNGELTLMHLKPLTGRTHQLRVHMSYMGMPIYGDFMYGAPQKNERCRLHCAKIRFLHPITRKEIEIEATIPDDIKELEL